MSETPPQAPSPEVEWQAQWIGMHGATLINWKEKVLPAPMLRTEFSIGAGVTRARLAISGLGYYELRLNGRKVGDRVLDPTVTQYDRRVRYATYDVSDALVRGANAIGVILGNGWYNCHTTEVWHFDKASWRDYPKLLLQLDIELEGGEKLMVSSGPDWLIGDGPIRFDGLRNGETYDARLECPGWDSPDFSSDTWNKARVVPGPGGVLEPQRAPPCKVMRSIEPVSVTELEPGVALFDLGQNIAGWAQLRVEGPRDTEIVMRYAEKLAPDGDIDASNIDSFIKGGDCQTDRYILKGDGLEVWEPRFTYHGFRYVQVLGLPTPPNADQLRGQVVHTAMAPAGSFECSDETLNRLQECTLWAYRGNFVGIPTDCPHREKNGWTGDAQLAAETGLWNFNAKTAYLEWLQTLADTQRPSGQLPGIAPSTGWGYNWGSGPAWDSALILIPWHIYVHTGSVEAIERLYEAMRRYIDFCSTMASGHIVSFGLGDWCHGGFRRPPPSSLTSTGYYYRDAVIVAKCAAITDRAEDAARYRALARDIRAAFNERYYRGDGIYAEGQPTALACAVYQGLVEDDQKQAVVDLLAQKVRDNDCRADFGILGAKYVPRVLADEGHAELALRLFTQEEFPGWAHWLARGATTLWESWKGHGSRNHVMFGDVSAWMYHYLAGIVPDEANPGFTRVSLMPRVVAALEWVTSTHRAPSGTIGSSWRRDGNRIVFDIELPAGTPGRILVPGATGETVMVNGSPPSPREPGPDATSEGLWIPLDPGATEILLQVGE